MSTCAALSAASDEPMSGTAAHAPLVVGVEVSTRWAAKALESDALAPIRNELGAWLAAHGARLQLVRQPARRCEEGNRFCFVSVPGRDGWLRAGEASLETLVETLDALHRGEGDERVLRLVCAHGTRDRCCALEGTAYYQSASNDEDLWLTSHIGGHRFAPTMLVLPSGLCYGRLAHDDDSLAPPREKLRGRVSYEQRVQAAEIALLRAHPELDLDAFELDAAGETVTFRGALGVVGVDVHEGPALPARMLSCGDEPSARVPWQATIQESP